MRKFVFKMLLFLLPIFFLGIVETCFLPINFFAYRNWEAIMNKSDLPHYGIFYHNKVLVSNEVGDLGHYTNHEVVKNVVWKTDNLGFRNDSIPKNPEIVIIGDSFINGTSLSQEDIFSNQLIKSFGNTKSVYAMAPMDFDNFFEYLSKGLIKKPKTIVFSIVERNNPLQLQEEIVRNSLKQNIKDKFKSTNVSEYSDRFFRFYSLEWLKSRVYQSKGKGILAKDNSQLLFHSDGNHKIKTDKEIDEIATVILSYKNKCKKHGIKFIFLPMPNKETVYYKSLLLNNQPDYLIKLHEKLIKKEVLSFNTLAIYNKATKGKIYYHTDDTHWNKEGVKLIAKSFSEFIIKNN